MARQAPALQFHKSKMINDKYILGDEIGKGAYGRVYKGLDVEKGNLVAIKQVSLDNIPPEDLASIMQEIDLLKNLNHQNIVKYQGSFKTKSHLYIILEYVENGSLANMVKPNKFGALRENVVAVYIAQVLEGLVYLHEQGVIHRDIKGANILTTKEGMVKLADFGVATKLTEADINTHSVVGTPYWMAPEVIEMSGVSAASDIWSVGCTVIELLTTVPPYYDLQPMPALFRIVQDVRYKERLTPAGSGMHFKFVEGTRDADDRPPLPELPPLIMDFLQQCFRKDAKLRPDARTLLKHPWLRNTKRSLPSSIDLTGERITINSQDASTTVERTFGDGDKEDRKPVPDEASTAKDLIESGSDDEHKTVSSSQSFESSLPSSSKSNSIRRARINIPRVVSSMQRMAQGNGFSQASPTSQKIPYGSSSSDRVTPNNNHAVDGSLTASRLANSAVDMQDLSDRFASDLNVPGSNEVEDLHVRDINIGRGSWIPPRDTSVIESPYSDKSHSQMNGLVDRYAPGFKQKSSQSSKSQSNGSHHISQRFEIKEESRDYLAKQAMEITRLVSLLKPDESEESVVLACRKLVTIFQDYPEQKAHLISQHGFIPLVDMLDVNNNRVIYSVLQLLNHLIRDNSEFQENACLVGLIPMIMNFGAPERSREIRIQAAVFVQQICLTSSLTLQMFIACRGLPVLVSFLEPDYTTYREMIHIAIDAMWQVFELQNATTRNDFCRIFAKSGVLVRLVNTLYSLNVAVNGTGGSSGHQMLLRSRSGPLEPRIPQVESSKPRSCQLDPKRVYAGYMEPHRQVTGLMESSRLKSPQPQKSSGIPEYVRGLDSVRGGLGSGEPLRMSANLEGGHEIPWQSPARSHQISSDKEFASRLDNSAQVDMEQSRGVQGTSQISRASISDQFWQGVRTANGAAELGHQEGQPLLSLLEKEPPSRSGQPDQYRNVYSGTFDRPDNVLPVLHHAAGSRKANGKLDAVGNGYTGAHSPSNVGSPSHSSRISSHGVGSSVVHSDASPSSKAVPQRDSGHVSTSGTSHSKHGPGTLSHMVSTDVSREYIPKVVDLLLEFARADTVVKSHMCSVNLLIRLFQMLNRLEPAILLKVLKCIKELSTDPYTLEYLQRADAMKHLVPFLELREGIYVSQIHNQVLNALYNLCKINKRRQEQAVESGIIPHLMYFIDENSLLKQFALPLLCDMAHASRYTREQLRVNQGLEVYLDLLEDDYWAVTALDSLAVCLAHDNDQRKVEQALLKRDALQKLVAFFQSCSGPSFVHILEPFLKIITKSVRLNTELAVSGLTPLLVSRLDHQDAIARLNLLKLIKAVYEHHPRPKQLIVEHDLPSKLRKLIEERRDGERSAGGQVLVKQMATALLKALHINTVL